jgi:Mg-chelatase subunit ChlD
MLGATVTFLTPRAAYLAALAAIPLGAYAVGVTRVDRARRILGLPPPESRSRFAHAALLCAVVLLLVVAAMQPAVRRHTSLRERTDAQAFVVLDTSRSMLASPSPNAPTRLASAKRVAQSLALRLHGIPLGVATFTDRVLPDLFPTSDPAVFDSVVESVRADGPPPRDVNTVATTFDALTAVASQGFFPASVRRRAVVLVTDGESRGFDPQGLAAELSAQGIALAVVRVGSGRDRVRRADGAPEANYRPDPTGARVAVARLRQAAGAGADPVPVVERALGTGPTRVIGVEPRSRTLSPLFALLALVPLAAALGISPGWLRRVTSRQVGSSPRKATA